MLVPRYEIRLSPTELHALEALQRAGKTPPQTVRRVTLLLLAPAILGRGETDEDTIENAYQQA
jgi:hypothetical protein